MKHNYVESVPPDSGDARFESGRIGVSRVTVPFAPQWNAVLE